ncbi:chitin deacetylase [Bordetella genomosp. 8]|uniref:Chitin deacetylase n=1 Tax=Bordetella genomosp. 8 TaxID=1416806 RepID=A0A1W6YG18_9BORD|nr:polysaccharide deacetylase family protein [Bordetella genomosp. 8]ARP79959.1 chitin deacetylase [Bordetella genomosp. 8]
MTQSSPLPRDLAGYGQTPPDPQWPGGARVAVNIVINVEEGSEPSVPDGDDDSEVGLIETGGRAFPGRDLGAESMFEYGSRAGFWRLWKILRRHDAPATFFACSRALERNPEIAAAIRDGVAASRYDVCGHGLRWERHQALTPEAEARAIHTAFQGIEQLTGAAPAGWYCRYAPTIHTRRIVAEHGGFLYDSDAYNDDLPYWTTVDERPHLVVPYTQVMNDAKFLRGGLNTGADFFDVLREQFDALWEEGATEPKMMSIGLHCRVAGHPFRATALERFLRHIGARPQVWLCRRVDIARHWIEHHPWTSGTGAA